LQSPLEGYTYRLTMPTKKKAKPIRVKVTTTLDGGLWEELQVHCVRKKTYANDILEKLIAEYLRNAKKKEQR